MKNNKYNIVQPLLFSIILAAGMLIGYNINDSHNKPLISGVREESTGKTGKIEEIIRFIDAKYLYKTNQDKFTDKALKAIFDELDPFSAYIPSSKLNSVNDRLDGNFRGIGISSYIINDTLTVLNVLKGTPAEKAGLKPLDKIIQIGNHYITGDSINHSIIKKIIQSYKEEPFDIVILDRDNKKKVVTIHAERIENNSVSSAYMLPDSTLYMKIEQFTNHTYREFMEDIEKFAVDDKISKLIIDLRGNPGGYLQEVTKMLDQFFDKSKLDLVTTVYHDGRKDKIKSSGRNFYDISKIVVLIDGHSASGSEVLAGVLQDYDRGIIIGNPSFGKGLVQEQYNLSNGGALRLTIANYYLPTGRSIQKSLDLDSNFVNTKSSHYERQDTFYSINKHRPLISGRGIYPDYFVNDTLYYKMQGILYRYDSLLFSKAIDYIKNNKELYDISEDDFVNNYNISLDSISGIDNPDFSQAGIDAYKYMIKSKIAFILFGKNAEEKVLNRIDPYIEEAEKHLRDTN